MEALTSDFVPNPGVLIEKNEPFLSLKKYLPKGAYKLVVPHLENRNVIVKITPPRLTRTGSFSVCRDEVDRCRISISDTGNKFQFLITLLHEIAHMNIYYNYKWEYRRIKPHGHQWKSEFQNLVVPLVENGVFPSSLKSVLEKHMLNPTASTSTDVSLLKALKKYALFPNQKCIDDLPEGSKFMFRNGIRYIRGRKRLKRIECLDESTGKRYLFHPEALVEAE